MQNLVVANPTAAKQAMLDIQKNPAFFKDDLGGKPDMAIAEIQKDLKTAGVSGTIETQSVRHDAAAIPHKPPGKQL